MGLGEERTKRTQRTQWAQEVSGPHQRQQLTRTQEAKDTHSVAGSDHDEAANSSQEGAVHGWLAPAGPALCGVVEEHQHRHVGGL